ncbi:response regulator transcription factor [Nitratireductor pacificus]|uniref:Response regulator receiver protein n=1 Tax=Nitratireductor pacificus pht-3B TaxID=391937 RepID=K2N046_9HYPH|nr:response regulator transcription factor [Nitratireductor pacificus]EKF17583.1 response regulator receiver protein [Nitratireductor pacificus pht-3B]
MNETILVVAPDSAFRLSLRFMLESEGYGVEVLADMTDFRLLRRRADCVIVDEEVLEQARSPVRALVDEGGPVIILADTSEDAPANDRVLVIEKPLLGSAVISAVRILLDAPATRTAT